MAKKLPLYKRAQRAIAELFGHADYAAAEGTRLTADWVTTRKAVDDEIRWNATKLRTRARDLERNNALIRNYLRLLHTNVIGPNGFKLQAQVRNNNGDLNKPINDKIEEAWCEWCERPTLDERVDFVTFQRVILKGVARDGEAFIRLWRASDNPYGLSLEYIDPDLIDETYNVANDNDTNEVRMGVELDKFNRTVAYHVYNRLPSAYQMGPRYRERIPADQIIHLYEPERAQQTRGVSWMASIMVPAQMLDKYIEAELVGARMASSKMGFFQRTADAGTGAFSETGNFQMDFNPGSFGILPDGYSLSTFDPTHPGGVFGSFVKDCTRRIATGLGVSYNGISSDLEAVNYSSMRSGLLIERDVYRTIQSWWIGHFLTPVYREWMRFALLTGMLRLDSRDPKKFLPAKWHPRGWAWVDPLKDSQAGVVGLKNGLTSRTALLAEQGVDLETVLEELAEENRLAEQFGISIMEAAAPAPAAAPAEGEDSPETEQPEADDAEETDAENPAKGVPPTEEA